MAASVIALSKSPYRVYERYHGDWFAMGEKIAFLLLIDIAWSIPLEVSLILIPWLIGELGRPRDGHEALTPGLEFRQPFAGLLPGFIDAAHKLATPTPELIMCAYL